MIDLIQKYEQKARETLQQVEELQKNGFDTVQLRIVLSIYREVLRDLYKTQEKDDINHLILYRD